MDIAQHHCPNVVPRHWRILIGALLVAALMPLQGCRLCSDCGDLDYPAYGGAWQRTRRDGGRVGSVFDPAGAQAPDLVSRDAPGDPDELERSRQQKKSSDGGFPDMGTDDDAAPSEPSAPATPRSDELRERQLDDIENEQEQRLQEKNLDDIKVRIIPGRSPRMIKTQ